MRRVSLLVVPLTLLCTAAAADAQEIVLTPERVLELVATANPEVLIARAREAQAQGLMTTARARLANNPEVDLFLGARETASGSHTAEVEFSLLQRFEIAGQRGHRIASATGAVGQRTAEIEGVQLQAQVLALAAYRRATYARDLVRVSEDALGLSDQALAAATARFEAGETAVLDVNVAKVEQARARRERFAATAQLESALGELRELLALGASSTLTLGASPPTETPPAFDVLIARVKDHPDVRALAAGVAQAEAAWRLARANRLPDLFGGIGVRREEGEPVVGARMGVSIPLFQRQTGAIAAASARIKEAQIALDGRRLALETRLRATYARYTAAVQAADALTTGALPLVAENESLARDSYQAGKIGLIETLVIRRETFAARREALAAQLEVALAALDVRAAAGGIR